MDEHPEALSVLLLAAEIDFVLFIRHSKCLILHVWISLERSSYLLLSCLVSLSESPSILAHCPRAACQCASETEHKQTRMWPKTRVHQITQSSRFSPTDCVASGASQRLLSEITVG